MKTNKSILKNPTSDVGEVLNALRKVNNELLNNDEIVGVYSVRIGSAEVYLKENEKDDTKFSVRGSGEFFFHLNANEPKLFYISDTICRRHIKFINNRGQLDHGRYFNEDEIIALKLFDDAYEIIQNKLIEIREYNAERIRTNREQAAKISSVQV